MVSVTYQHGREFNIQLGEHQWISDQPAANGGRNRGPTAAEMFVAAIGASVAYYALVYLEARSLPTAGLTVEAAWDTASSPKRINQIRTRISLPAGVPLANRDRIRQAAERSLLHNTLCNHPEVVIEVSVPKDDVPAAEGHLTGDDLPGHGPETRSSRQ